MPEKKLGIGILGCGPIAQFAHLVGAEVPQFRPGGSLRCGRRARSITLAGSTTRRISIWTTTRCWPNPEVEAIIIGIADRFHVPAALRALGRRKARAVREADRHCSGRGRGAGCRGQKKQKEPADWPHARFDPGMESAKAFISTRMGEMLALKAWYCDSTHRYSMTDAVQPLARKGSKVLRPDGDPKADKQRYFMLTHGSHLLDLARYLGGPIRAVQARLNPRFGAHCWFIDVDFVNGAIGHLDLTIGVRMDWHEPFQIYGEHGSASAKIYNPWFYKSSDVELFHEDSATTTRVLGADSHFYRLQLEGFADSVLLGAPMRGTTLRMVSPPSRPWWRSRIPSRPGKVSRSRARRERCSGAGHFFQNLPAKRDRQDSVPRLRTTVLRLSSSISRVQGWLPC